MKKNILWFFVTISSIIILNSCDPHDDFGMSFDIVVTSNAQLLNYKDTFNLGDTLKFSFQIPDSITYNGKLVYTNINSTDFAHVYPALNIIDTSVGSTSGLGVVREGDYNGYAIIGSFNKTNKQLSFENINSRFKALYYLIPLKRGVYFIDERDYGRAELNSNNYKTNVHFSFGNINRHFNYILDNLKANQVVNMSNYLSTKGENQPKELLAFYVK